MLAAQVQGPLCGSRTRPAHGALAAAAPPQVLPRSLAAVVRRHRPPRPHRRHLAPRHPHVTASQHRVTVLPERVTLWPASVTPRRPQVTLPPRAVTPPPQPVTVLPE